ncbi:hypothetical protein B0T16DRAFT_440690 [Cercophora newfieldiana]|uniref:Uncharacterized protein n=1 Tax=Cercophora newfieldiana TaxID=92897 RepID=A0AA39YMZ8_9PEZI|nr:hypothetical protein B0T16DRAFT_440690 [Cercophora newfieldiana]
MVRVWARPITFDSPHGYFRSRQGFPREDGGRGRRCGVAGDGAGDAAGTVGAGGKGRGRGQACGGGEGLFGGGQECLGSGGGGDGCLGSGGGSTPIIGGGGGGGVGGGDGGGGGGDGGFEGGGDGRGQLSGRSCISAIPTIPAGRADKAAVSSWPLGTHAKADYRN